MQRYILFDVSDMSYAYSLDTLQRIIMMPEIESVSGYDKAVKGMFSHEGEVINVLDFRSMINKPCYEDFLSELFEKVKGQHVSWLEALEYSVEHESEFTKQKDPHKCDLGKWLDSFNCYDDEVNTIYKKLYQDHIKFHKCADHVLSAPTKKDAKAYIDDEVKTIYFDTIGGLKQLSGLTKKVACDEQKLLILKANNDKLYGLTVDTIDAIVEIDEDKDIKTHERLIRTGKYMDIGGVLDYNGKLRSVIGKIKADNYIKGVNGD